MGGWRMFVHPPSAIRYYRDQCFCQFPFLWLTFLDTSWFTLTEVAILAPASSFHVIVTSDPSLPIRLRTAIVLGWFVVVLCASTPCTEVWPLNLKVCSIPFSALTITV